MRLAWYPSSHDIITTTHLWSWRHALSGRYKSTKFSLSSFLLLLLREAFLALVPLPWPRLAPLRGAATSSPYTWTWDLGYQVKDRKGSKEGGLRCWTCVSPPRRQAGEEQPGGAGGKKWFWAAHQVPEQRGNCEVMVSCEYRLDHIIGKHGVTFWIWLKYLQGVYLVSSMDELWEREKKKYWT